MRVLSFLLLVLLFTDTAPSMGEMLNSEEESVHRQLKAEVEMGSQPRVYFVFDLPAGKILFRSSGITVAEMPIAASRVWGRVPEIKIRSVIEKHSLFAPRRENLAPSPRKKADGGKFDLKALELEDMPKTFQLRLDDGTRISIRSFRPGFFSRLLQFPTDAFWYLTRPLISDWNFFHGKPYTELLISLQPQDVQQLYWSMEEGARCIVHWSPQETRKK
jgi:hypothetical protein